MTEKKITITIDAQGGIFADAENFTGTGCLKEMEALLEGITPGVVDVKRKRESGADNMTVNRNVSVEKKA